MLGARRRRTRSSPSPRSCGACATTGSDPNVARRASAKNTVSGPDGARPGCTALLGELGEALLGHAADLREVAAGGEPRAGAGQREDAERAVRVRVPGGE